MYETREWIKYFTEVRINTLKKKPKAKKKKCNKPRTICLIALTSKTLASVLQRRNKIKIEDVLGEDQFGIRRGKRARVAENNI